MIDIVSIVVVFTGVIAIFTLRQSYKKNRNEIVMKYYEKTQELREKLDSLRGKEKAKSLFNRTINFYNVMSYSILSGIVNERDAFYILKKNIFGFSDTCKRQKVNDDRVKYLNALRDRWEMWGITRYTVKQIVTWIIILTVLIGTLWIVLFVNGSG